MADNDAAPTLTYATPVGFASPLGGACRLGGLVVAPRGRDGTVALTTATCVVCNGPAERQWRRSAWYFRRGYLWWLVLSVYGLLGLGITAWISHRTVRVTAGLCRAHHARRRWRLAIGTAVVVVGVVLLVTGVVLDATRGFGRSAGAVQVFVGPAIGFVGFVMALAGVLYVAPRAVLLKPIWADDEVACLAGAGRPFLDALPPVHGGAATDRPGA